MVSYIKKTLLCPTILMNHSIKPKLIINKEFVIDRFCRFKYNFREGICADQLSCAAHAQNCAEGRIARVGMPSDPRNLHPRRRQNDHRETQQKWENKRKCSHAVR